MELNKTNKRKGNKMSKKDIIIWGYKSKYQTENNKPRITKFKLSKVISDLNFITNDDENFPFKYYINKKQMLLENNLTIDNIQKRDILSSTQKGNK